MNPHPPLTGFPPVLAVSLLVLELLSLRFPSLNQRSFRLLMNLLLSLFTGITYFSGFFGRDVASPTEIEQAYVATHEGFARLALILSILQLLLLVARELAPPTRRAIAITLYSANLVAICIVLWYTATLGGAMVFDHGIGVQRGATGSP